MQLVVPPVLRALILPRDLASASPVLWALSPPLITAPSANPVLVVKQPILYEPFVQTVLQVLIQCRVPLVIAVKAPPSPLLALAPALSALMEKQPQITMMDVLPAPLASSLLVEQCVPLALLVHTAQRLALPLALLAPAEQHQIMGERSVQDVQQAHSQMVPQVVNPAPLDLFLMINPVVAPTVVPATNPMQDKPRVWNVILENTLPMEYANPAPLAL